MHHPRYQQQLVMLLSLSDRLLMLVQCEKQQATSSLQRSMQHLLRHQQQLQQHAATAPAVSMTS
jgi:hypothetical protein